MSVGVIKLKKQHAHVIYYVNKRYYTYAKISERNDLRPNSHSFCG